MNLTFLKQNQCFKIELKAMAIVSIIVMMSLIKINKASIAGVTYVDNFDFEKRYRNVDECNPLYWHPLHLPNECIQMYEQLIRANLGLLGPIKVLKEKDSVELYKEDYISAFPSFLDGTGLKGSGIIGYKRRKLTLMQKMIEMIRKDSMIIPIAPEIRLAPNIGPVAMYHQPISSGSEKLIKEISGAYRNAMVQMYH